jgi:hypothetical protein
VVVVATHPSEAWRGLRLNSQLTSCVCSMRRSRANTWKEQGHQDMLVSECKMKIHTAPQANLSNTVVM